MSDDKAQILLAAESGIVTLFSNQLTGRLRGWGTGNVFLVCMAAKVIKDTMGMQRQETSRIAKTTEKVLQGVILSLILDEASATREISLQLAHLLCIFYLMEAFNAKSLGGSAKYVFATKIAQWFQGGGRITGIALGMLLQTNMGWMMRNTPRIRECAQMVVVQLALQEFQGAIPEGMMLATLMLFLHFVSPIVSEISKNDVANELYIFALYQAAGAMSIPGRTPWVQAIYAIILWMKAPDKLSGLLGQLAGVNLASRVIVEGVVPIMRTDPALAICISVLGTRIVIMILDK